MTSSVYLMHKAQKGLEAFGAVDSLCCQDEVVAVGQIQLLLQLPQVAPVSSEETGCTASGSAVLLNDQRIALVLLPHLCEYGPVWQCPHHFFPEPQDWPSGLGR